MTAKPAALSQQEKTPLLNEKGELTKAFAGVVDEIFRKFDLFIGRELSYSEFKSLYNITNPASELTQEEFDSEFLPKYCSTKDGITHRGLKDYFRDSVKQLGEDAVRTWLTTLGYDEHLFNKYSRGFTLTFHSVNRFQVEAKDALRTDLHNWAHSAVALL